MADAGIAGHMLQDIFQHQSIETAKRHVHRSHRYAAEATRQARYFIAR